MIAVSYNISPGIRRNLDAIDEVRKDILLTVLSLQNLQYLRWETMIDRIYWGVRIRKGEVSKKQIISSLAAPGKQQKPQSTEAVVWGYKRAMEYIQLQWLATDAPITIGTLEELGKAFGGIRLHSSQKDTAALVTYLQHSPEHPVVLAGIALAQCIQLAPYTKMNEYLSWCVAYLFLYRAGYNVSDLVGLEQGCAKNPAQWYSMLEYIGKHENMTIWLEYFSGVMREQLLVVKGALAEVSAVPAAAQPNFFWKLTDRQKEILLLMDQPGIRMTNKKVQGGWRVSAITASRELTKLAAMGLIFTQGKGRSVYYTRI